jgi:hypothetical protein
MCGRFGRISVGGGPRCRKTEVALDAWNLSRLSKSQNEKAISKRDGSALRQSCVR